MSLLVRFQPLPADGSTYEVGRRLGSAADSVAGHEDRNRIAAELTSQVSRRQTLIQHAVGAMCPIRDRFRRRQRRRVWIELTPVDAAAGSSELTS